jgi:mycofactocin precursor
MPETTLSEAPEVETTAPEVQSTAPEAEALVVEESLVEEVSIDGMCGVY